MEINFTSSTQVALTLQDKDLNGISLQELQKIAKDDGNISKEDAQEIGITDENDLALLNLSLSKAEESGFTPNQIVFSNHHFMDQTVDQMKGKVYQGNFQATQGDKKLTELGGITNLSESTKEQRLHILEQVTQKDNLATTSDGDRCTASCIVAAAFYNNGADGLIL